jgi:hypothetical protein
MHTAFLYPITIGPFLIVRCHPIRICIANSKQNDVLARVFILNMILDYGHEFYVRSCFGTRDRRFNKDVTI